MYLEDKYETLYLVDVMILLRYEVNSCSFLILLDQQCFSKWVIKEKDLTNDQYCYYRQVALSRQNRLDLSEI